MTADQSRLITSYIQNTAKPRDTTNEVRGFNAAYI